MDRIRDEKINLTVHKVAELMVAMYVKENVFQHLGMILAGPSCMKEKLRNEKLFQQHFGKHLQQTVTIAEVNDTSIHQVTSSITDVFKNAVDQVIQTFEAILSNPKNIDLIVFGEYNVMEEYNAGNLSEIFVTEDLLDTIEANKNMTIHIVASYQFVSKYGSLVGIKYFSVDD